MRRIARRNEGVDMTAVMLPTSAARSRELRVAAATTPTLTPTTVASVAARPISSMLLGYGSSSTSPIERRRPPRIDVDVASSSEPWKTLAYYYFLPSPAL